MIVQTGLDKVLSIGSSVQVLSRTVAGYTYLLRDRFDKFIWKAGDVVIHKPKRVGA